MANEQIIAQNEPFDKDAILGVIILYANIINTIALAIKINIP